VIKQVLNGERGEHWRIIDNQITTHGKVYVPPESPTLASLLAHAYGCGHEGTEKMLHRLRGDFRVPGARALVRDFMRVCTTCQRNKTDQLQPASLLQLLPVSSTVWVDIRINFIEGLPKVKGRSVILTVVDTLQIRPLPTVGAPVHGHYHRVRLLRQHRPAPRCAQLHRQ
jgi:hypothetical protein